MYRDIWRANRVFPVEKLHEIVFVLANLVLFVQRENILVSRSTVTTSTLISNFVPIYAVNKIKESRKHMLPPKGDGCTEYKSSGYAARRHYALAQTEHAQDNHAQNERKLVAR